MLLQAQKWLLQCPYSLEVVGPQASSRPGLGGFFSSVAAPAPSLLDGPGPFPTTPDTTGPSLASLLGSFGSSVRPVSCLAGGLGSVGLWVCGSAGLRVGVRASVPCVAPGWPVQGRAGRV